MSAFHPFLPLAPAVAPAKADAVAVTNEATALVAALDSFPTLAASWQRLLACVFRMELNHWAASATLEVFAEEAERLARS